VAANPAILPARRGPVAFAVVGIAAFAVSALTLFSGFGLGTLWMPVFALFFPVPVAVASTALVHAANNAFKVALPGRLAPREVVMRFGQPVACPTAQRAGRGEAALEPTSISPSREQDPVCGSARPGGGVEPSRASLKCPARGGSRAPRAPPSGR